MAEPGNGSDRSLRATAEELFLAGVGVVALTKERTEELVDELAGRGKVSREDARTIVDDVVGRWRGEALRVGERAGATFSGLFRELGLVTRREYEELELRLAQLEHRLRLVEGEPTREPEDLEVVHTPPAFPAQNENGPAFCRARSRLRSRYPARPRTKSRIRSSTSPWG